MYFRFNACFMLFGIAGCPTQRFWFSAVACTFSFHCFHYSFFFSVFCFCSLWLRRWLTYWKHVSNESKIRRYVNMWLESARVRINACCWQKQQYEMSKRPANSQPQPTKQTKQNKTKPYVKSKSKNKSKSKGTA